MDKQSRGSNQKRESSSKIFLIALKSLPVKAVFSDGVWTREGVISMN